MNAENKLKEMGDRGWHIKVSRQKNSDTWDVVGALNGWKFREGKTFSSCGRHTSLLAALLDMEQMLLEESSQSL